MFLKYVKLRHAIWPVSTFSENIIYSKTFAKLVYAESYKFACDMLFIYIKQFQSRATLLFLIMALLYKKRQNEGMFYLILTNRRRSTPLL